MAVTSPPDPLSILKGMERGRVHLRIEKLIPGGDGMARHEGRIVFVPGTLPGEEVTVEFEENKKDFVRGHVIEILRPSPDRIAPPCPVAGTCGGCNWQHIRSETQGRFKVEMVREALRRVGKLEWLNLHIESGEPFGYRNRLQLHTDGSGALGFLERGGKGFVPVKACPVSHPSFAPLFQKPCAGKAPERFHAFTEKGPDGASRLWREDEDPKAECSVSVLGQAIRFPLKGFFQSNIAMLERLIPYALEGLKGGSVFDLYSGVGTFAVFLKSTFPHVLCVESHSQSLEYARRNVGSEQADFLVGGLEKLVAPSPHPLLRKKPDAAVIDPPRTGLAPEVRAWLKQLAIPRLVYASCDPVTLARDLMDLLAGPYALEDLRLFDFYPQTHHVEAVAKLVSR